MNQHTPHRRLALPCVLIALCVAPASAAAPVWNVSVDRGQAFGSAFADPNTSVPGSLQDNLSFNQLIPGFVDENNIVHDLGNSDAGQVMGAEPNAVAADAAATITADGLGESVLQLNWSCDGANNSASTANYTIGAEVFSGAILVATVTGANAAQPVVINYQWSVQSASHSPTEVASGFEERSLSDILLRVVPSHEEVLTTIFDLTSASQPNLGPATLNESGQGQLILPPSAEPRTLTIHLSGAVMNNLSPPSNAGIDAADSAFNAQVIFFLVPPPTCAGDANADNQIDAADLSVLLAQFGSSVAPGSGADFNNDAVVNGADLSVLLGAFGTACP